MQIIQTTGLITINATLIIQLLSFLVFLFIINRLMLRPLRGIMAERDGHMERMRQDALAAGEKCVDYTRQLEAQRDRVKSEAFAMIKKLEEEGRDQAHDILIAAGREISALREEAEKDVGARIVAMRKNLLTEAEPLAVCMMEQVLRRRLPQ